jgi:pimeloyl-ACP methyl ester carboxylesterase
VPYPNTGPLATAIPQAQLVTLPGAGHLCWFEEADGLSAVIGDFYASVTAS